MVVRKCECRKSPNSWNNITTSLNVLELPPVVILNGIERIQFLLFQDAISPLMEGLGEIGNVELISMQPLYTTNNPYPIFIKPSEFRETLSERQLEALILAVNQGYYEIPRKIPTEELASRMEIGRRTFIEHLQKAENKIFRALVPLLMFQG
jgi:predicted DNA binding protein